MTGLVIQREYLYSLWIIDALVFEITCNSNVLHLYYEGGGFPLVRTSLLSTLSSGCSVAAPATPGFSPTTRPKRKRRSLV